VLVLHLRKGRDVFIGVPAGDTTAKADALLRERSLAPQVDDTGLAHHLLGASNK
jgi:hypothetical protein